MFVALLVLLDELLVFVAFDEFLFFIVIHHPFMIRMCVIFVFIQKFQKFILVILDGRNQAKHFFLSFS